MAHPDDDQAIGRLVGARLRGAAGGRAVSGAAAEAHPDAETWAAYVDGGLGPDEVVRLDTHLAGCPECRRLLAVLAPEVSSGTASASREAEAPAGSGGVVIPFPRRQVFAWMAVAAGLLMAVTLWSVSRLGGDGPVDSVAMSTPAAGATGSVASPPTASPARAADAVPEAGAPPSRLEDATPVDQVAGRAPAVEQRRAARQGQDEPTSDPRSDALARRPTELSSIEADRLAQAARAPAPPAATARDLQLQTNTSAPGARPRGPSANQQANQQAGNLQQQAPVAAQTPQLAKSTPPPPPPAAAPVAPPAQGDAPTADTRERRANEPPAEVAETVTVTSSGAGAGRAPARPQPARSQVAGAEREGQARSEDEATFKAFGSVAAASTLPSFAEPSGRLRWRIADGRHLESSSDGGTTWNRRYTAADRLRAGTAPAIDSAWAVGERGLVVRFAVPGDWTAVSRPGWMALVAVTATGAQSARVTAVDGSVFETADGGATWTPASPGAGRP